MEQVIDTLRRCHQQIDEEAATRALEYCRRLASGRRTSAGEELAAIDFLCRYDQSLDWVFRGVRDGTLH